MNAILSRILRPALVPVILVVATITGCSSPSPSPVDTQGATVIDVRTPAEFAAGHLEGAVNIDWEAPTFAEEIAAYDTHSRILLYCRSGNRAGQARQSMLESGFTDVTTLGGVDEAAKAVGVPVVT
jgi:rhodanese-related sulfurtransferase